MTLALADRVLETSATTGTGTLTLLGAVAQYQTFSAGVGNGNTTYYGILDGNGTAWEVGLGTVAAGTLARTLILASTNSNAAISLSSNTHNVFGDLPASVIANMLGANNNVGRNLLHNYLFRISQRGAGPFTANGYGLDRWAIELSTSTMSVTPIALSDSDRTAIGDEAATNGMQTVVGGTAGAADYAIIGQRIESVNRTAGKTIAVSFWAVATSGTPKLGVGCFQFFGTGGSPSAAVSVNATPVTLSTTWTRYTVLLTVPSVSGKTFGSAANTDYLGFRFWLSSGATNNTVAGGIGVQSFTFKLWGVQLEISTFATQLEKADPGVDQYNCRRFYRALSVQLFQYASVVGAPVSTSFQLDGMRTNPTVTPTYTTNTNCSGQTVGSLGNGGYIMYATGTAATSCNLVADIAATADL